MTPDRGFQPDGALPGDAHIDALAEAIVFAHESEADPANDRADLDLTALERTAALAAAAVSPTLKVPDRVAARLAAAGLAFCSEVRSRRADEAGPSRFTTPPTTAARGPGVLLAFVLGAAAAGLAFWLMPQRGNDVSFREMRAQALASDRQVVHKDWQPGPSELRGAVEGDVVWCQDAQDGWLTFRGLPKLDPERAYQLWIVDAEREGESPVDGGVFTIADAAGETVVPIRAKLPIGRPAAFVVTVEKRQGVVVSKKDHIVAIASL